MIVVLAGLAAGFVHVVAGPDHLAAVAPLSVAARESAWKAGVRWGVGHSLGVALVGALALALREALPLETFSGVAERLVGVTLIGLGLWGLARLVAARAKAAEHRHGDVVHSHLPLSAHERRAVHEHASPLRLALGVGTLHGLAGSSHLLGVLPALALPTRLDAGLYLGAFALGTVAAMAACAWTFGALGARKRELALGATSVAALGVGVLWLVAPLG
ncbi:MAG: High-affinity nickel transporter [Planctomycetes bacterium]|nr:High-affinity nickel transporter [Planctomycetota bacterium]